MRRFALRPSIMTTITVVSTELSASTRLSGRTVFLVLLGLACLLYSIWQRTVPPGPLRASEVDADTMCLVSRIGLPCRG